MTGKDTQLNTVKKYYKVVQIWLGLFTLVYIQIQSRSYLNHLVHLC